MNSLHLAKTSATCRFWVRMSFFGLLTTALLTAEKISILNSQIGNTPSVLGYNLGHFMPGSNAADWFNYSGADAARVFISVSDIEPTDDIAPRGDGVDSRNSFFIRRDLLRQDSASTTAPLGETYVKWSSFISRYSVTATGNNRIRLSHALAALRDEGVDILANITASPSRFAINSEDDWAGKWELWQHYYAQAFLLSRDYGVRSYSMFNEPNNWTGMTEEDWLLRYRICSDAIQSAVVDMNSRYGRSLIPQVVAPTTANGSEKYNSLSDGEPETWGRDAIVNRHLRLDGTYSTEWMNLHVYSYQKYTTRSHPEDGLSGFMSDYDLLRGYIDADMPGEPSLPMALTEFNVRTGASYDTTTLTQDSPSEFSAFGANCIALTERGINQIYAFKFGQTASASIYGVAKNGTHFVDNNTGNSLNNYGSATRTAEVYRLFCKAATGARHRYAISTTPGASPGINSGLWSMATHDVSSGTWHVFLANREAVGIALELDFSALDVPPSNPVFVEEVSAAFSGGVVRTSQLSQAKLASLVVPAQAVLLVTLPSQAMSVSIRSATANTTLADGSLKNLAAGGSAASLAVRADGTTDGRRASLIRIPVPAGNSPNIHSVLLELDLATSAGSVPVRAHVYGVSDFTWDETSLTWSDANAILKQNVPAGNQIANNIVANQGSTTRILGQVVASSVVPVKRMLDVTEFARSSHDGFASFLIVQDHRWDVAQPELTSGDTQAAGIQITSRTGASPPRLLAITSDLPPVIEEQPESTAVKEGAPVTFSVSATGLGPITYQWYKNGQAIIDETSSQLTISSAQSSDAGSYQVIVSNPASDSSSQIALLAVNQPELARSVCEATIRGGTFAEIDVDEAATGYLMVKHSSNLDIARKSYFQFILPAKEVDQEAPATFRIEFQNTFAQQVQLWSLKDTLGDIRSTMTWTDAPANDTATNELLRSGTPSAVSIGDSVRISPGSGLTPYTFTLPRLGDFTSGNRVILALSGVDSPTNNAGGLRIALASSTLRYAEIINTPPSISKVANQSILPNTSTGALPFTIGDQQTAAESLLVTATSSNLELVPEENISLQGSGAERGITVTPQADLTGFTTITLTVSDGDLVTTEAFVVTVNPPARPTDFLAPRFSAVSTTSGVYFHTATDYKGVSRDLLLDVYQPQGDWHTNRPVVMLIHGGGFRTSGTRTQSYIVYHANEFAKRGFVAISIDYRQRSGADMPTKEDELPALKDAAADAMVALQWIRGKGPDYGYDPETIFVVGGSAGGRIATVLGCRETGDMGGLPTTDSFSTTNPPSSITSDAETIYDRSGLIASAILWGGPEPEFRCYTVDAGDLPSILIHGTYDSTVQTSGSLDHYLALTAQGIPAGLHLLNGYGHSLATSSQASASASAHSAAQMASYFVNQWERTIDGSPVPPSVADLSTGTGADLVLEAPFTSSQDLALQWRRDGIALAGQTGRTLSVSNLTTSDAGLYEVVLFNPTGSWDSNIISAIDLQNAGLSSVIYDADLVSFSHPKELCLAVANLAVTNGPVPPQPPVANDDTAATAFNTPVTIEVLSNDSDPNGDPLTISSVTQGAFGSVVINEGLTVTYTPSSGYSGTDSFTYTINDGAGGTATATVNITVRAALTHIQVPVSREATISSATPDADVDEAALGYISTKFHAALTSARKAYFQFDLGEIQIDETGTAIFRVGFANSAQQDVQLWALDQSYGDFSAAITWNGAQANSVTSNSMLGDGIHTATAIESNRIIPTSGTLPVAFEIPKIGSYIKNGQVTLILTGVSTAGTNSASGARYARNAATLELPLDSPVLSPWDQWKQTNFGSVWEEQQVSGPGADPDSDGIVNLLEYALGGEPLTSGALILPTLRAVNGGAEFQFMRNPSLTDILITLETAETLDAVWSASAVSTAGGPFIPLVENIAISENGEDLQKVVTIIDSAAGMRRFFRLKIELANP